METLLEYKCPCCGGALSFDSSVQMMKCPYCDTEFEVAALKELDDALQKEGSSDFTWQSQPETQWTQQDNEDLRTYVCKSCGGTIVTDLTTAATHCPYCDNPVVMAENLSGTLKPDLVVPFLLNKDQAKAALSKHISKKPLLPRQFKTEHHLDEIKGIYVPYWLFGAEVRANIRYLATRIHTWSDSRYIYTRTSHFSLIRGGSMAYDNVPVDGSQKMADDLMESLEPYDLRSAVDFQTAYLAGYLADKFDVDEQTCKTRANQRIQAATEQTFANTTAGYATVLPQHTDIKLKDGTVRYALLPVWLLTTRYKDKTYTFAMNGQTGKMVGNLPIHWGKFFGMLAGISLGSGVLFSILGHILGLA